MFEMLAEMLDQFEWAIQTYAEAVEFLPEDMGDRMQYINAR